MTLKAKKTIQAKIVHLTGVKQRLLEQEYNNLQRLLQSEKAELNSDYNGTKNIMKRGLGLMSKLGATVNLPKTTPTDILSPMMRVEAHIL